MHANPMEAFPIDIKDQNVKTTVSNHGLQSGRVCEPVDHGKGLHVHDEHGEDAPVPVVLHLLSGGEGARAVWEDLGRDDVKIQW